MEKKSNLSAVSNKEIERILDNFRIKNSPFIIELYKYLRNINADKLKDNIVVYDKDEFSNFGFKDRAIGRVVVRYEDIMLCIDVYNRYKPDMIVDNMKIFAKVIRAVARNIDLDRVIYVRVFKKGDVDHKMGYQIERGYRDRYREFNEDILDLLTISLEQIEETGFGKIEDIMKYWQ